MVITVESSTTRISARLLIQLVLLLSGFHSKADEGMWLYSQLQSIYPQMKSLGFRLTPEDVYSINQSCLKDAVVSLGFCTGGFVSSQGLLLTNHHCAYDAIQNHTDTFNNYLDVGFWAKTKSQELPAEGMIASVLVRIEDVTRLVDRNYGISDARQAKTKRREVIDSITRVATDGTDYEAQVVDMFAGNQVMLCVYVTYRDLRLVGVPPQFIGKFGHDTDNWMWPRHTGDFAFLRVYTSPEGKPADYSEDNVPIVPKHFFPVSIKGVEMGDFAMMMGFPGYTDRYSTSYEVDVSQELERPLDIKLRSVRMEVWKEYMDHDKAIRYMYSSKYSGLSNDWKYYLGQSAAVERLRTTETKRAFESDFTSWVNTDDVRRTEYGSVLAEMRQAFDVYSQYVVYLTCLNQGLLFGIEAANLAAYDFGCVRRSLKAGNQEDLAKCIAIVRGRLSDNFDEYLADIDKSVFNRIMPTVYEGIPPDQRPKELSDLHHKYKGNWAKAASNIFSKTIFASRERCESFLRDPNLKKLTTDPLYVLTEGMVRYYYDEMHPRRREVMDRIEESNKTYMNALLEMNGDRPMYADANGTPRLTYGKVIDYRPRDAVHYGYHTTTNGILEKYRPDDYEFDASTDFLALIRSKAFGQYGKNGQLNVCFLTDTDITGGNSGSPVLNAEGQLVGIAFDNNWEAMAGDLAYDPELNRTISVDIRYVLFVVDKYAGAGNIIAELTIVENH